MEPKNVCDYVVHSGVKGMKWGVWNEETKRRRVAQKKRQRKEDMTDAAKSAAISAGITAVQTAGNPVAVSASFATSYASRRIAQQAVRKGKPVIDQLIKDERVRPIADKVAQSTTASVVNVGLRQVGSQLIHSEDSPVKTKKLHAR